MEADCHHHRNTQLHRTVQAVAHRHPFGTFAQKVEQQSQHHHIQLALAKGKVREKSVEQPRQIAVQRLHCI